MLRFFNFASAGLRLSLLAAALLLGAAQPGRAQELTLYGVPEATPIVPVDGHGNYIFYRSEAGDDGRDIYAFRLLDDALKVRYEYVLQLPVGSNRPQVIASKTTFALVFQNSQGVIIHTFHPGTGAHQQTEIGFAPDRNRQPSQATLVTGTPTEGFCLVKSYVAKDTIGFRISVLDAALQPKWTRLYMPATLRQQQVQQVTVSKDVVGVVLSDAYRVKPGTREARSFNDQYFVGLDASGGKELFRKPLQVAGSPSLTPDHLAALADGRVVVMGQSFSSRIARADSSLGLFLHTYRPDGTTTTALTTWDDLGTALRVPALRKELMEIRGRWSPYELFSPDGTTLRLVGDYSGRTQAAQFVVASFDAAGQRTALYPVARNLLSPTTSSAFMGVAGRYSKEPYLLYSVQEPTAYFVCATPLADQPTRTTLRGEVSIPKIVEAPIPVKEMPELGVVKKLQAFSQRVNELDEAMKGQSANGQLVFNADHSASFASANPRQTVVYRFEPLHKQLRARVQPLQ